MAIIPKKFLNAVVSIGVRKAVDSISWIGTGFFVIRMVSKTQGYLFLATNKHVVENIDDAVIRMKAKDSDTLMLLDLKLKDGGVENFKKHPSADIAVIQLNGKVIEDNNLDYSAFDIDSTAITSTEMRNEGIDEGSIIYMLGYPMGLVNEKSGLPICRLGCIARMSEAQIAEQHNILVDIQNFPGNSGSPIVTRPEFVSVGESKSYGKCSLIGIVHSYIPYKETLQNTQTGEIVEIRSENSGLANVHPVEFIREVIDTIQPKIGFNAVIE